MRTLLLIALLPLSTSGPEPPPLRSIDSSELLRRIEEHRGKVILLHVWATWCPPCLEEFPDVVAVAKKLRGEEVVVLSVSADRPDRVDAALRPFLDAHRPAFPVYLKEPADGGFARAIDPEWDGTLPATFFINRRGEIAIKLYSKVNRRILEKYLRALLDEPS